MLEQRLGETEAALFDAVEQLQTSRAKLGISATASNTIISGINVSRAGKATKTTKMAEWKKFPLETALDVETWWHGINSDWGLGSGKSAIIWKASQLIDSESSQRALLENTSSGGTEMQSTQDHYNNLLQTHHNELENFDGILEPAYDNSHLLLQGRPTAFPEDDHAFSLAVEGGMQKEYSQLEAEEDANQRHGNNQGLNEYGSHGQTSPMSMASPFNQGSDAPRLQENTTRAKAYSLSKKLDHIYY